MYQSGFGNYHATEAIAGALPTNQNSPQECNFGLYAEQLSGSAFTEPRSNNRYSWLYRTQPSAIYNDYKPYHDSPTKPIATTQPPNAMRWSPIPRPAGKHDFIDGLQHIAGNCVANTYIYHCNQSMENRYFHNRDGELLFVPYEGKIRLNTEFGILEIAPGMIAVIPRGVFFNLELSDETAAGYLCENKKAPLTLPNLGPIGANGLANPRHFLYPTAQVVEQQETVQLLCKYQDTWWGMSSDHTPLNVVAWHGNYAPYCYDLSLFNTINTVSFDHPDPSISTVLTSQNNTPGVANLDFVIFPERWMVAEHTFRPPYYHRNLMNELMGLVHGRYDAKQEGFSPGGISIHNCMTGHGPDQATYEIASKQPLKPKYYKNTLAIMFESIHPWLVTEVALQQQQKNYTKCWSNFKKSPD